MVKFKNSIPGLLMICSLALLIVLQVLWLAASWREAKDNFRREANVLFRNVILSMQDSLFARNIEPLRSDDTLPGHTHFFGDSLKGPSALHADTMIDHVRFRGGSGVVEVLISDAGGDSVHRFLRPLVRNLRMNRENRKFVVHLGPDSLSIDSIATLFRNELSSSGIAAPFNVHRVQHIRPGRPHPIRPLSNGVVSEAIPFSPVNFYAVSFPSVTRMLIKEIAPEALFAFFVTLMTATSFYVLHSSMRAQKKLVEMKNDLISNISHELKTPVATVSVALEALENFKGLDDPRKTHEYLRMAKNELNRLAFITDTVLQSALMENGISPTEDTTFNFDEMVLGVIDSMKLVAGKRGIGLLFVPEGKDFVLTGRYPNLVTVVYNLLDNAIKYSVERGSKVTVRLVDGTASLALSVEDQGLGIPEVYRHRVFEKFFRVPSGDVHNIKGYGLGLSYVATVIENHGGTVRLDSKDGEGTRVTVVIPKVV